MTERELFFKHLGLTSFQPMGLEITKAEGIYLYDKSGKAYVDLVSGFSVSNIGHRHPTVLQAIQKQLDQYLYINVYGEFIQSPQVRLAVRLHELLPPPLSTVYFVNSGSEAIEGAMKLAKRYTGRTEVAYFRDAYHGSTQGALSILGNETLRNAFRPLLPGTRQLTFNNFADLDSITSQTACVVAETIQAEAGIILPKGDFLRRLRDRCSETGSLLIIDDVQMGFGRSGKLFSFEHFGIVPDILVLAKALGGGMPLGAFIASKEIMDSLAFNPELGHITTFGGHPVSCAAALASLDVITGSGLLTDVEEKGRGIEASVEGHPKVKEIRRKGLMLAVEFFDGTVRQQFTQSCLDEGLIIDWFLFSDSSFRIAPPLTITFAEIEEVSKRLIRALAKL
jgi:acetylornithine/succinyldiaminopimelate/putrescine aminotransferase